MSDILEAILSTPEAFDESAFENIQEQGLTRSIISKLIAIEPSVCESAQQYEVVVAAFFHLVDELYVRGCCKDEICALARLTAEFWQESFDRPLKTSVTALQSSLAPLVPSPVSERSAQLFLAYTVRSCLQHLALYRACLATSQRRGRPVRRLRRNLLVEAPTDGEGAPAPLAEGRTAGEHEYHRRLRELDTEEQLERAARTARRLDDAARLEERREEVETAGSVDAEERNPEYPKPLVSGCVELNLRQLQLQLQDLADSSSIDLVYKAKRTALPRPASMGPPPRFPVPSGGSGERKSAASSRKSSARSKGAADGKKSKANK